MEPGADPLGPGEQLPGDAGVGAPLDVGGTDDGDGLGPEEPVQVGHVGMQWPPADIEVTGAGGPAPHHGRRRFPAGGDAGPAGVGGQGAMG